jgi:hypothetical protein
MLRPVLHTNIINLFKHLCKSRMTRFPMAISSLLETIRLQLKPRLKKEMFGKYFRLIEICYPLPFSGNNLIIALKYTMTFNKCSNTTPTDM